MAWLRSRLNVLQSTSLYLVLGLGFSVLFLVFLSKLAEAVFEEKSLVLYDELIVNSFHANTNPVATQFFLFITRLGYEYLWILLILVITDFVYRRQWIYLFTFIISIWGAEILTSSLKLFFSRPRPIFDNPILIAGYHSFPSGHALMSFVTYGLLAYFLLIRTTSRLRRTLIVIYAALLIALIGLSRIYLGVHYLSDIIAGYVAGGFWLSTCITIMHYLHRRYKKKSTATQENPLLQGENDQ